MFRRHRLPVKDLFTTSAHAEMVSRLKYIAEKRCFGLITGEVGAGKTTALRKLVALLNPNKYKALYISDSALTPRNFYWEAVNNVCQASLLHAALGQTAN